jgi:methylmalonyl-CoA mutase cobalamin-binding domain/chain
MLEKIMADYTEAIYSTDREQALRVVQRAVDGGVSAEDIVFKVIIPSIDQMLASVTTHEASLAQHFLASQIASDVVDEMVPRFRQKPDSAGTIVIGTSSGDFHGLGKRIVKGCLTAQMFQVTDLGLNVAPERFVEAALEQNAQIIGISSLMVHTARGENGCRRVRQLLAEQGLEGRIKIIVGGAPYRFDDQLFRQVGADAWAENAIEAGAVIARLIREVTP